MSLLQGVVLGFMVLELTNVAALYFAPDSTKFNSVGVFRAWTASKSDPELHRLIRYLVNWVAGVKLIFLGLLAVILLVGDERTLWLALVALSLSTMSFFWRLFPLAREMDAKGELDPPNYSKVLGGMIATFIVVFVVALVLSR